jgi:NADPH-dependent 2,4-dienoyl-CoA reductase/sulfur reductase-like enzyme
MPEWPFPPPLTAAELHAELPGHTFGTGSLRVFIAPDGRQYLASGATVDVGRWRITPEGLFVTYGAKRENGQLIECDTIVLCAGQEPLRTLQAPLAEAGVRTHLIGGAAEAAELDAKRAIDQGTRLAAMM